MLLGKPLGQCHDGLNPAEDSTVRGGQIRENCKNSELESVWQPKEADCYGSLLEVNKFIPKGSGRSQHALPLAQHQSLACAEVRVWVLEPDWALCPSQPAT